MWIRFIMIGLLSLTATWMLIYQGIEITQAFKDFFNQK